MYRHERWLLPYITMLIVFAVSYSCADDWPHWRGPARDDIVAEPSGWQQGGWPPGDPIWRSNFGIGSTSPLVVNERLYTVGWQDGQDTVYCVDAIVGKPIWQRSYPSPKHGRYAEGDKNLYAGPTATPEYDSATGLLYTLGVDGQLNCWDTTNQGKPVWGLNLYDTYDVKQRPKLTDAGLRDYGYTTSPLLYGNWLLVQVGDDEGCLMAFDKRTGARLWASENRDPAGHTGSMAPMQVEGVPCVAALTLKNLVVIRLDTGNEGRTVGEFPWVTDYANSIAGPAVYENSVIITSGYNQHAMSRLEITLNGIREVWHRKHVSKICTPIIYHDHIYWCWSKVSCVDFATGELQWEGGSFGDAGSCIITGDGRMIVWAGRGTLALVDTADASLDSFHELAHRPGVFRTEVWPHVVLCDGRIYVNDRDGNLACFEVNP